MGNGDTNLYTKEIVEDLLSVIFLNLLERSTANIFQDRYGCRFSLP